MDEPVIITKENAIKAYKEGNAETKKSLINLCGAKVFSLKITDRVNSIQDVFDIEGKNYEAFMKKCHDNEDTTYEIAFKILIMVAKVLNQGWVPDWKNSNQKKWAPVFDMSAGVAFSYTSCVYTITCADAGSRLCFETEELARHAGIVFNPTYKEYLS